MPSFRKKGVETRESFHYKSAKEFRRSEKMMRSGRTKPCMTSRLAQLILTSGDAELMAHRLHELQGFNELLDGMRSKGEPPVVCQLDTPSSIFDRASS